MSFTPDEWVMTKGDVSLPLHVTYELEAVPTIRLLGEDGEDVAFVLSDRNHAVLKHCTYARMAPIR